MRKEDMHKNHFIIDILMAHKKLVLILNNTNHTSGDDLLYDVDNWDICMRRLEIIGEATKNLLEMGFIDEDKYRIIVDFRNEITHGYFGIDKEIIWNVLNSELPQYIDELKSIINENNLDFREAISELKQEERYCQPENQNFLDELSQKLCLDKENKKKKLRR